MEDKQQAILVGVEHEGLTHFAYEMEELFDLATACEVPVVGQVTQSLKKIHPSHYLGKGKLQELKSLIEQAEVNLVICNDELTPSQLRNLEKFLDCKVIDRTTLILEIFAIRARTRESQLQVEIAQLQYMLPRLVGLRTSFSRQSGGVGTKNRGLGEKQLELDRRKIETRISYLKKELNKCVAQRKTQRQRRMKREIPFVALVGYTNAGKSTLMNAMLETYGSHTRKQVFEKDMLFATLETSVRKIELPYQKTFLLADTVGFVSRLPHHLVQAFRSTLEEVTQADLLIQVVDLSHPEHEQQIETTIQTLQEIGAKDIPIIYALNKAEFTEHSLPKVKDQQVYLSAKHRIGIQEIGQLIQNHLFKDYQSYQMFIPYAQEHIVADLHEKSHVIEKQYQETGTYLEVECSPAVFQRYQEFVISDSI